MNEQEIDSMPAGPEMDALVAEKVIGFTLGSVTDFRGARFIASENPYDGFLPRYSMSIWDAWNVVELFRDGFADNQVAAVIEMRVLDTVEPDDCECRIYSPTLSPVYAKAREMPLAICRAALKAALKAETRKNRV